MPKGPHKPATNRAGARRRAEFVNQLMEYQRLTGATTQQVANDIDMNLATMRGYINGNSPRMQNNERNRLSVEMLGDLIKQAKSDVAETATNEASFELEQQPLINNMTQLTYDPPEPGDIEFVDHTFKTPVEIVMWEKYVPFAAGMLTGSLIIIAVSMIARSL